jgi:hypothetical protein
MGRNKPFVAILLATLLATTAAAQTSFPARRSFSGITTTSSVGGALPGGGSQANPRFVRGNRRQVGFIGLDRTDARSFVGAAQAIAPSAGAGRGTNVTVARPRSSGNVNVALKPAPRNAQYQPTLELASEDTDDVELLPAPNEPVQFSQRLTTMLQRLPALQESQIRVSLQGDVAVLDGSVASADQNELVEQLLLFEPGVDRVESRLRVVP